MQQQNRNYSKEANRPAKNPSNKPLGDNFDFLSKFGKY